MAGIIDDIARMSNSNPFVSAPSSLADQLQRAIENQVAGQRQAAAQASGGTANGGGANNPLSTYQQLQQNLQNQINSLPSYSTPIDQLRQQATTQANAQYNPLMDALRTQMSQTTNRAHTNEKSVKDMYGGLSKDLASQIPAIKNDMHQQQQDTSQRYTQAQQSMKGDYQKQAADQQAVLKQLGISGAAPDANAQAQNDQQYFQNQSGLDKQTAMDALQQQQNSSTNYQQNIADSSRLAGNNAASDIGTQLETYLQTAGSQLGTLGSQRAGSIETLLSQLQGADQTASNQQHQQAISNLMSMANFNLSATKANDAAASKSNSLFKGTSGPDGAANYLSQAFGSDKSGTASQIMSLISDTMANKDVTAGKHQTGTDSITHKPIYQTNNNQYIEDILKKEMEQKGGYSSGDINSAINALLAYLGKNK